MILVYIYWPYAVRVSWRPSAFQDGTSIPIIHHDSPMLCGYSPTRDGAA